MIKGEHNKIWLIVVKMMIKVHLLFHFREREFISLNREHNYDIAKSTLIISNHFWFWDGFIHLLLAHKVLNKRVYIMMLHSQLIKHRFLRKVGCFSIDRGSRDIIESLIYSIDILKKNDNALLIFPTGKIESIYKTKYSFQKGINYIISKSNNINICLNYNTIDYFSNKKPTLTSYYKIVPIEQLQQSDEIAIINNNIEDIYNKFVEEAISLQLNKETH